MIVDSDPLWPLDFEAERRRIAAALGDLAVRIEHNGSTAVPGLAAKPIINIQVSVPSLQPLAPFVDPLGSLSYVHVPHADNSFCPFFHRPAPGPHTKHVHLVLPVGYKGRRPCAVSDYLRQ